MYKKLVIVTLLAALISACSSDDSIGKINGEKIAVEQFDAYLKFKRISVKDDQHRAQLIRHYLEREALMRKMADNEMLDKNLLQAEVNDFKQQMVISRYFEKYLQDVVTDQAVQNFYTANAKEYEQRQAHIAHILFRLNKGMNDNERLAKLTAAQEMYSKLKANGDFEQLATEHSEDKHSAKKGGDLGWLKFGSINLGFSEVAFGLKEGAYSEPFETPFGYHIVKLLEKPKMVKKPFEALKGNIRYKLRQQAKMAEIEKIKSTIKIEVSSKTLRKE